MRIRVTAWLGVFLAAVAAHAAEVRFDVSARETYVGMPVVLSVVIEDASEEQRPRVPEIPGATVQELRPPSRQSSTTIINGRVSSTSSVTYRFQIVPEAPGTLRIPAVEVVVDGRTFRSTPIEIAVNRPSSGGDLMAVEVEASDDEIFLGQPVDLTLVLWIRPYVDQGLRVRLDEGDMWSLVDDEISRWGPFAERIGQLRQQRRRLGGREVLRPGADGEQRAFYRYELTERVWPDRVGPLDLDGLAIAMAYPERLERDRSIFSFRDLRVAAAKPVRVVAEAPAVTVKPLPEQGRPAWFTGAVGSFDLDVSAVPTEVAVGEPITITLRVRQRGLDGTRPELLRPPALTAVPELVERFRVPDEPLAGVVEGRAKRFTQSIRAVREDVTAIPAIPFAFFDPRVQRYETVWSDPIPLQVRASQSVSMSDVIGGAVADAPPSGELTELAGGLLANYLEPRRVLGPQRLRPGAWLVLLLVGPPLAAGLVHLVARRRRRLHDDAGFARQRRARRRALSRLAEAGGAPPRERAEAVADALEGYVADRCNLPAGAATRADVADALRRSGVDASLREQVEQLLADCEAARYAGLDGAANGNPAREARTLIDRLERQRL